MRFPIPSPIRRIRGFSLTELAVVVGVMGVAIGAIVGASNLVSSNSNIQSQIETSRVIVDNFRSYMIGRASLSGSAGTAISSSTLNTAGIWPSGVYETSSTTARNIWGGTIQILVGTTSSQFRLRLNDVPADECRRFVAKAADMNGLVSALSSTGTVLQANIDPAKFVCPVSGGNSYVQLEFSLRTAAQ